MAKTLKPKKPRTAFEYLAEQTGTDASEWRHVTKSSRQYRRGFRYWHPGQNIYAKRIPSHENNGADVA